MVNKCLCWTSARRGSDNSLTVDYISSKFLAERAVLDAVAHHGLSAKVMRVGNLAPRSYGGEFQANFNSNSFMGRLKVFYMLGCCPYDSL